MKIVAILQARTGSTRLPNKVLKQIMGKPMLEHQLLRIKQSKYIEEIVVATSTEKSDEKIEQLCLKIGVKCFRGDIEDVLDRFYQASKLFNSNHIVRLTGDCPLTDSKIIDDVIQSHIKTGADYSSNVMPPTFPDGLDIEIFKTSILANIWKHASLKSEREHVTLAIRNHPQKYSINNVNNAVDSSHHRWTVDEISDFEFVSTIYKHLYEKDPFFTSEAIFKLLDQHPQIYEINSNIIRNEGLIKSLEKEQ